jgi:hypothetical protein
LSDECDIQKKSAFKGVAFIEQHPAGFFIKGSFPANLLMKKLVSLPSFIGG